MRTSLTGRRTSTAVLIYVIILVSLQVFLITVAAEAFLSDDEALAWTTAAARMRESAKAVMTASRRKSSG